MAWLSLSLTKLTDTVVVFDRIRDNMLRRPGADYATGVQRISIGALTHSAPAADIGLDWTIAR